jgi:hypothetical protein
VNTVKPKSRGRMTILVLFQRWQNEVDRLLFVELSLFIGITKTSFDKRKVIKKVIARYDSADRFSRFAADRKKTRGSAVLETAICRFEVT